MTDRRPAIQIIEEMWREATDTPIPPSLLAKVDGIVSDVWVDGYKNGKVAGWNERNEEDQN